MATSKKPIESASEHEIALTLYQAFRRSNDVMFYCGRDGTIMDVNDAFVRHYGWSREEAVGQNPRLLRSRYTTPETYREMWSQILDPRVGYWRGELVNRTKDGREVPVILTITAVRDEKDGIVGYVSNAMDIGDLRRLQERVAQTEALAQLGQMAAVVAHEIRNPLGSIVMAARQLAGESLPPEDRDLVLKILRDESQRLNETLTNFLSYARPRPLKLERADLNAMVSDVARIVAGDGSGGLAIETAFDASLAPFRFDPDQIRQVAWNIALNAAQALEGKGRVRLLTGRRQGFAFLRVEDEGPGIAPEAREELFRPFRTTKSHGTGLGLAIADRIVRAHGGRIEIESAPGEGVAFTVFLPTAQG
jgi:two-component system sensor histidine kinase PilS (NtrC family)